MLPFEIRAIVPSCFNDYAVRRDFPLTAFSTCTPLCRRAKICLYLRHRAFRSEQSRHRWKDHYRSFALTKNSKYVKMRPPGKAGRPSEWNNTANAGRIVRSRTGRKILPAFLLGVNSRHLPPPRYRRKKESAEIASAQIRKKKFYKKPSGRCGVRTVKGEASSRPCMPQSECGTGYTGYRIFSDPSPDGSQDTGGAFRSRVQRPGVRHRSMGAGRIRPMWLRTDLVQVKRDRHTGRP